MEYFLYLFSFFGILCSLGVILSENPVYSVFYLVLVFCCTSSLLFLLTVDFLGVIFIVVYVGAIAVLFLFVVMMFNIELLYLTSKFIGYYFFVVFLIISVFVSLFMVSRNSNMFLGDYFLDTNFKARWSLLENNEFIFGIGNVTYTSFGYVFVLAGFILLLGMVGSICLTLSHSSFIKRQEVYKQVSRDIYTAVNLRNVVQE